MTDLVPEVQKKNPLRAFALWAQRLHQWLMEDDTLTTALSPPPPTAHIEPEPPQKAAIPPQAKSAADGNWTITRPALAEMLWGESWHLPLGEHITSVMVRSFGLTKEMAVLDLAAGLGGSGRQIVAEFDSYVTGLETDAERAAHGNAALRGALSRHLTLAHYVPTSFKAKQRYDGVIANELLYQIANKKAFVTEIAASLKDHGHVSWTDLVLQDDLHDKAIIQNWLAVEPAGSQPLLLSDVVKFWKALGFDVRVSEDRTSHYVDAVTTGLTQLIRSLEKENIASSTKPVITKEIEFWARRMAAFGAGLRYYRFYAFKS
jgi:cyclopropane fatty-acyl-phospholipid synthase-like methyltransferase